MKKAIRKGDMLNKALREKIEAYKSVQPKQFPQQPKQPSSELIERYYEARRRMCLMKRRRERLMLIQDKLEERIKNANEILRREQDEQKKRAVSLLSPTVARLRNLQTQQHPKTEKKRVIEISMFEKQLEAIGALKDGEKPRQIGAINYDFEKNIADTDRKIKSVQDKNQMLFENIVKKVNTYLHGADQLSKEIDQRKKDMASFQRFAEAYYNSINEIERMKYTKLLQLMKNVTKNSQVDRFQKLYEHLCAERKMIDEQLSLRGTGDFNTNLLKSDIEFQSIYLGHLSAIAGKALSHISTIKEPIDPLEEMQANIVQMELQNSKMLS